MIHVQGHKIKYSNCNNSAADCPISLKFRTEFDRGEARLLHVFTVKVHRSRSRCQSSRSQRNVTSQQEKRSKTATDGVNDFKLGTGDELQRIGTTRRRAASSCNTFAIATFSSCNMYRVRVCHTCTRYRYARVNTALLFQLVCPRHEIVTSRELVRDKLFGL